MSPLSLAALLGGSFHFLTGCGELACNGLEKSPKGNAPEIVNIRLVSQLKGNPWQTVFGVSFEDSNGDLGSVGKGEMFLNGKPNLVVDLASAFSQAGLLNEASSGELPIILKFTDNIKNGTSATLGMQLVDAEGLRSNCYSLDLEFTTQSVD